jgi:hypothetical protein
MTRRFVLSLASSVGAAGWLGAGAAPGQLVIGTGDRTEPGYAVNLGTLRSTNQYPVTVNIADSTPLPFGTSVWGLTANDPARELYFIDVSPLSVGADPTTNLFRMSYDSPGTRQLVGTIRHRTTGFDLTMQGLAFDTSMGRLYGSHTIGGTPGEGFYELDIANPVIIGGVPRINADLRFEIDPGTDGEFNFANLDYDPVTNKVYGIDDDADGAGGRALYHVDIANQQLNAVVSTPTHRRNESDFDGLATGGGKAFFVTDEPGFVYIYDLVNGGPYIDFLSPVQGENGLFAGAAFAPGLIPEPGSSLLAGSAAAALGLSCRRGRAPGQV